MLYPNNADMYSEHVQYIPQHCNKPLLYLGGLQSLEIPPQKRILDDLVLKTQSVNYLKNCLINKRFTLCSSLLLSGSEYVEVVSEKQPVTLTSPAVYKALTCEGLMVSWSTNTEASNPRRQTGTPHTSSWVPMGMEVISGSEASFLLWNRRLRGDCLMVSVLLERFWSIRAFTIALLHGLPILQSVRG